MGDVIRFNGFAKNDIDPDEVLKGAIGKVETVIVIGYDKDEEDYFDSSVADGPTCLWLIERLKKRLLEDEGED